MMRALLITIACAVASTTQAKTLIFEPVPADDIDAAVLASLKAALSKHPHAVHSGWVLDPTAEARRQKADLWMQVWFENPQGERAVWARVQSVDGEMGWWVRLDDISDPKKVGTTLAQEILRKSTRSTGGDAMQMSDAALPPMPRPAARVRRDGLSVNINPVGMLAFDWYTIQVGQLLSGYHYLGAEVSYRSHAFKDTETVGHNLVL